MAIYDTMNLKNKGGAVPTYKSGQGSGVYSSGSGVSGRIQSDVPILQQTGEAIARQNKEILTGQIAVDEANAKAFNRIAGAGEAIAKAAINFREKYAEAKASELATQYRIKLQGLMFNQEGTGLLQTQQEDARGTSDRFQETGNSYMEELLADYGEDVKSRFYAKVNDFNMSQWEQTKRHEYTEFNKWEVNTATAEAQNFADLAIANGGNPELLKEYLRLSNDAYTKAFSLAGFSGEALERKKKEANSKVLAGVINSGIKANLGRAEAMFEASKKFMTASDIEKIDNRILQQKNYLETKALRAENAARTKKEAELKRFVSETQPKVNSAIEYAWGTGKTEDGRELVEQLRSQGLETWANAVELEMKSVEETLPIISKLDNMDLPEAMKEYSRMVELHNQQKDITGVPFEDARSTKKGKLAGDKDYIGPAEKMKANAAKLAKIGAGLQAKQKAMKQNPSQAAIDSGQVIVQNYDGSTNWKATFSNMNEWMTRNGVLDVNKQFFSDDQAKQNAADVNNSPAPFSHLTAMEQTYGSEVMPYLVKQMKEKGLLGNIDVALFRTLDDRTANRLTKFEQNFNNPNGQFKKYNSAVIKNEAETNIGIMSQLFDANAILLRSYPEDVRASMLFHGNMLAMMYFDEGKDGQNFKDINDAAKQAFKDLTGDWEGYVINGGSVRFPLVDYDGTKLNPDIIKDSINEYLDAFSKNRDTFFYKLRVGENIQDEKVRQSIENTARKNLSVMNNGTSDGFYITYKGYIVTDERGLPVSIPKTYKDLNTRDFVAPTDRLPNEGLEHIDMWR